MKNGKCMKCGATDVHHVEKRYPEPRGIIGITLWSSVPVDDYICGACGFRETYLSDLADMDKIKKKASVSEQE